MRYAHLTQKPIAIIPARGGSKRVPRKNIVDLCGQPLLSYAIQTCISAGIFSHVIVSTEDEEIAAIARSYGAEVDVRPENLAADRIPATAVIKDLLNRNYSDKDCPDHFCLVYPMAAFINVHDLSDSLLALAEFEGVMGVCRYTTHPYKALVEIDGKLQALWPDLNSKQSQNFPDTVASNGTFCWMRTDAFLECMSFYPENLHGYIIPDERAVDIDTLEDLDRARRYMEISRKNT